jgi:hypothetical protein
MLKALNHGITVRTSANPFDLGDVSLVYRGGRAAAYLDANKVFDKLHRN